LKLSSTPNSDLNVIPVRSGYEIDCEKLASWMATHIEPLQDKLQVYQYAGGQSNPTYKLIAGEKVFVLRRQPSGEILKGAHAVDREARVMQALAQVNFPVPKVYAVCEDQSVIGSMFVVMEAVEGRIFWDLTLPDVPDVERAAYFNAMCETISQLHCIDPMQIGLDDYGRHGNYLSRQISRWSRQYQSDDAGGKDINMDRLVEWLPDHIPEDGDQTSIVHGDFRIDNMIFHPTEPRVIAVLDWELSTLGNPLADFAYHSMMYRTPSHIVAGLADNDPVSLGIPSEDEYIKRYCGQVGRDAIGHYEFYVAFNLFRLAGIFHGIAGRVKKGTAVSAEAAERAMAFPELAALAWRQVQSVRQ